jgi:hypothetical protein
MLELYNLLMQIFFEPANKQYSKCLVLVGGSGDTVERFAPLVKEFSKFITDTSFCSFNISATCADGSLLELQSQELLEVFHQLTTKHDFKEINIFTTSMGAYASTDLLSTNLYSDIIKHMIFYDPADYYIGAKFTDSNDVTWSGPDTFRPNKEVVSNRLKFIDSQTKISVVHLTLRNYSKSGYIDKDYSKRGIDHDGGYPRLNKDMVRHFFNCLPTINKAKFVKEPGVPHGFLRDGDITTNLRKVSTTCADLLKSTDR